MCILIINNKNIFKKMKEQVGYQNQKSTRTRLGWYQTCQESVKYRQYGQQEDAHEFLVGV